MDVKSKILLILQYKQVLLLFLRQPVPKTLIQQIVFSAFGQQLLLLSVVSTVERSPLQAHTGCFVSYLSMNIFKCVDVVL